MAGTIEVSPGVLWSATGWVFDVALRAFAAPRISDRLQTEIKEIMDENIGWFSFTGLSQADRSTLNTHLFEGDFLAHVDAGLPHDLADRQLVISHVAGLVRLAEARDS